jgi:hypothetical protein
MTTQKILITDQPLFPTPAVGVQTNMIPAVLTTHDDSTRTVADDAGVLSQQPWNASTPGKMGRRTDPNTDGAYEQEYATLGDGFIAYMPGGGDVRAYVYGYLELS